MPAISVPAKTKSLVQVTCTAMAHLPIRTPACCRLLTLLPIRRSTLRTRGRARRGRLLPPPAPVASLVRHRQSGIEIVVALGEEQHRVEVGGEGVVDAALADRRHVHR